MSLRKQSTESTGSKFQFYTGFGAVSIHAYNPSNEEYEAITGRALPFELTYQPNDDGITTNRFLVKELSSNSFHFADFRMSKKDVTTKAGDKFKFIDSKGQVSVFYPSVDDISENSFFDKTGKTSKLKEGQETFIKLLRCLMALKAKDNLVTTITDAGFDFNKVISGNEKEVRKLLKECAEENVGFPIVGFMFGIRTRLSDNKRKQVILTSTPELILPASYTKKTGTATVDKYWVTKAEEYIAKQSASGYPLKDDISIEFEAIDPSAPISEVDIDDDSKPSGDELPF